MKVLLLLQSISLRLIPKIGYHQKLLNSILSYTVVSILILVPQFFIDHFIIKVEFSFQNWKTFSGTLMNDDFEFNDN